jgi:putative hydrolase of the HAD superfamily
MIKAIVFDCFGVLTSDGWLPFKQKYFAHDTQKYQEATALNALANAQKITYQQFLDGIAKLANIARTEVDVAMHTTHKNDEMLKLVHELSTHYRIGMLSNISGDWLNQLFTPDEIALFDAVALSYKTGYAKPHQKAYEIIAQRLGCSAEECVFIDDQQSFVQAAVESGMHGILFKSHAQLLQELGLLLNKPNSNK